MITGEYLRLKVKDPDGLYDLGRLLRVKQWTKNLIIFVPALFAARIHEASTLARVSLCFAAFCMLSSSIYIINDIFDLKQDAAHPIKKLRPVAAGKIAPSMALTTSLICSLGGLVLMSMISSTLSMIGVTYFVLMLTYSLLLKRYVLVDVLAIAVGFVLRATAGALSVPVLPSGWFLLCTSLGALFLALDKRRQELKVLQKMAGSHRGVLNNYSLSFLRHVGNALVPCLLGCYVLFGMLSYHGQAMLLTVPFAIYGVTRYKRLSDTCTGTNMTEDVLIKDRPIQAAIILWTVTSALVVYSPVL